MIYRLFDPIPLICLYSVPTYLENSTTSQRLHIQANRSLANIPCSLSTNLRAVLFSFSFLRPPLPAPTSYLRVSRCFSSLSQIVASSITTIIRRRISPGRMQSENIIRPSRTSINAIGLTAKRREMSTVVAA